MNVNAYIIVDVMNRALEEDPEAITKLVNFRVACNEALGSDETIQTSASRAESDPYCVGLLGILNGICGIKDNGWGYIVAIADSKTGEILKFEVNDL